MVRSISRRWVKKVAIRRKSGKGQISIAVLEKWAAQPGVVENHQLKRRNRRGPDVPNPIRYAHMGMSEGSTRYAPVSRNGLGAGILLAPWERFPPSLYATLLYFRLLTLLLSIKLHQSL